MYDCSSIPDFLFAIQNIVGYKNITKFSLISASLKWFHLVHLQLLSRAVLPLKLVAEVEVSSQDEMTNLKA